MTTSVLYLDTSDLSYLARRDTVAGVDYAVLGRRIVELAQLGRLRLRLSLLHLTEAYRHPELLKASLRFLLTVPATSVCLAGPEAIFAAELDGGPVKLREVPLAACDFRMNRRMKSLGVVWPYLAKLLVLSRRLARQARRSDSAEADRIYSAVLAGDPRAALSRKDRRADLRPPYRAKIATTLVSPLVGRLRRRGFYHHGDTQQARRLQSEGLTWMTGLGATRIRRAVAFGSSWNSADAKSMPACALRIAFERRLHVDGNYLDQPSDLFDGLHLAYAAYSDAATVDKRVYRFTEAVHKRISAPRRLCRAARLDRLLDVM